MEQLLIESSDKIQKVSLDFKRYLLKEIDQKNRLIAIKGPRGAGKTTLLLQLAKLSGFNINEVLYVTMDDLFFMDNNLIDLARQFHLLNGKLLLLDEVHKYPKWSREIKLIYDSFPDLKVIFTSSSILEIHKAESDLSRRAISYDLRELSFREFLEMEAKIKLSKLKLIDITTNHTDIAHEISKIIKPVFEFKKYLQYGAYPYFIEDINTYSRRLLNTILLILEIDLPSIENLEYNHIAKIKKLLYVLSTSVPFTPNVSKISEKTEISRAALIKDFDYLEKARLIYQIRKNKKGITVLSKPDKIYLNNTNIAYALSGQKPDIGNLRETFFVNQLKSHHEVFLDENIDFVIDDQYYFEVGGKNKKTNQLKGISDAFIIKDDIENGTLNIIPLWLFGFLY